MKSVKITKANGTKGYKFKSFKIQFCSEIKKKN